jgi:SAM-dependent methyltransferase
MRKIDLNNERIFENKKQINKNVRNNQNKFYWATEIPNRKHKLKTYNKISGKEILEIGCSNGSAASMYTKYCKSYFGLDISDEAIKSARSLKIKNANFLCVDAHNIPTEDSKFDCVIVNSLLHHLDLEKSLQEIHRVTKKDGYLIFKEPLGTNTFFQIYRNLTPNARTPDEKPFQFKEIDILENYYYLEDIQYFGFLNIISAFTRSLFLREILTTLDYYLSKTFLRFYFWQFSGFAKKLTIK